MISIQKLYKSRLIKLHAKDNVLVTFLIVTKYPTRSSLWEEEFKFGSHFEGIVHPGGQVLATEVEAAGYAASPSRKQRQVHASA